MKNRDHVDSLISGGRRPSALWKPTNDAYRDIRILPSDPVSATVFRHWNVLQKQQVQCLGSDCPICAVSKALLEAGKRYAEKSEPRRVIEKMARQIKCEFRIGYNVLVQLPDDTYGVRVWATTGGNQRKISDLIALEKQEDPKFDPCDYLLNVGFFKDRRAQEMYQLKFKTRSGSTTIPHASWEAECHDLLAALEGNTVVMTSEQALSVMQESYGSALHRLDLGLVKDLVASGVGQKVDGTVSVGELEAVLDRAPGIVTIPSVTVVNEEADETPQPSNAQSMLDKLDG